jgi:CheY-like chemotaxis protein
MEEVLPPTTVLVADDEEPLLRLCSRLLEREGYAVLSASDGDETLRVFADHRSAIHTLVLDATLPPNGAVTVFEAIRDLGGDPAVIFTGGDAPAPQLRELIDRSGGVFLSKPFPGTALVRAVVERHPPLADPERNARSGVRDAKAVAATRPTRR